MSEYGGLLFVFPEPKRAEKILERLEQERSFTATASAPDSEIREVETCLLCFDRKHLHSFCLVRRRRLVATAEYRVLFEEVVSLGDMEIETLEPLSANASRFLEQATAHNTGRASALVWRELVQKIKERRPSCSKRLDELETIRSAAPPPRSDDTFVTIAQEKDAFGVAIEIFGADRSQYMSQKKVTSKPAPFMEQLDAVTLREDTMLNHDANRFPGWRELQRYQIGAVEFEKNGEHLTIFNVNRTPIEKTTGVDLIYYQSRFNSYVMVQYKRMSPNHHTGWCFRPDETQCRKELKRMQMLKKQFARLPAGVRLQDYRLNAEGFFFKLCKQITYKPLSDELVQGMYLPLNYWELLLNSPTTRGPAGGRVFDYENVERHLNNSEFVNLVQHGWVGSSGESTSAVTELIKVSLNDKRSVIFALESAA